MAKKPLKFETRGQRKARQRKGLQLGAGVFAATVVIGLAVTRLPESAENAPITPAPAQTQVAQMAAPIAPAQFVQMVPVQAAQPYMELCGEGPRINCVVDGDTIWLEGTKIRIADIDTPEVGQPRCDYEYDLGMQATYRLVDLLNAGPWDVQLIGSRDEDQYGRKLRVLNRNGRSIGDMLVAEGLARTWTGRREPWC